MSAEGGVSKAPLKTWDWARNIFAGLVFLFLLGGLGASVQGRTIPGFLLISACFACVILLISPGRDWRRAKSPALKGWMITAAAVVLCVTGMVFIGEATPAATPSGSTGAVAAAPQAPATPVGPSAETAEPEPGAPAPPKVASYADVTLAQPEDRLSRATFSGEWPLTVNEVKVGCDFDGKAWFETANGKRYAVNGSAQPKYLDPEPLWAVDEAYMAEVRRVTGKTPSTKRINFTAFLTATMALCP